MKIILFCLCVLLLSPIVAVRSSVSAFAGSLASGNSTMALCSTVQDDPVSPKFGQWIYWALSPSLIVYSNPQRLSSITGFRAQLWILGSGGTLSDTFAMPNKLCCQAAESPNAFQCYQGGIDGQRQIVQIDIN